MPSPFPGMDPFIESSDRWASFHLGMVVAISAQLNARLPERFVASTAEYVLIEEPGRRRDREPDVFVSKRPGGRGRVASSTHTTGATTIVLPAVQPKRRRYVQVFDKEMHQVITALELLSPANKKAGDDRSAYMQKRKEYQGAGLSLVEIDLLRGGRRLPLSTPPPEVRDYYIMVCRSWENPSADFWTFTVRDPLPAIPIPLTVDDQGVALELKGCLDRVYDESRYATELRYDEDLRPKLGKNDTTWVNELLAKRTAQQN